MGIQKAGDFEFITYSGDHPPLHVHVCKNGRELCRWDIEHQKPMEDVEISRNLYKALKSLGYIYED